METDARLIPTALPSDPRGVALVLHGGGSRGEQVRVSPTQLSVLRMVPVARRVARAGRGRLAVYRLLNSVRGWDTSHTPVEDVRWALERIRSEHGPVPVSLVGHSLGGRAALLAGRMPDVQSVVALAPWVQLSDTPDLPGRDVLVVHGTEDRIADFERARTVTDRLRSSADRVGFVSVEGGTHAMLRHRRLFDGLAGQFVASTLFGDPAEGPVREILDGGFRVEA